MPLADLVLRSHSVPQLPPIPLCPMEEPQGCGQPWAGEASGSPVWVGLGLQQGKQESALS